MPLTEHLLLPGYEPPCRDCGFRIEHADPDEHGGFSIGYECYRYLTVEGYDCSFLRDFREEVEYEDDSL